MASGQNLVPALVEAMNSVETRAERHLAIPNRYSAAMKEIWLLQPRFEQRRGTLIHWVDAMLPMEEKVKRVEEIYQAATTMVQEKK
jgi:tRNA nucleotidyltransferase/poly(A) polymerase